MTSSQADHSSLAGLSILVVEDDYFQAEETMRSLTRAGAKVMGPFSEMKAGLRLLEDCRPDCAIIDLNLGDGGPSFELARELTSRRIPIVIVSGYDAGSVPADLIDVVWVEKPTGPSDVIDAVRQATDARFH